MGVRGASCCSGAAWPAPAPPGCAPTIPVPSQAHLLSPKTRCTMSSTCHPASCPPDKLATAPPPKDKAHLEQHVLRLDVAVDELHGVQVLDRLRHLNQHLRPPRTPTRTHSAARQLLSALAPFASWGKGGAPARPDRGRCVWCARMHSNRIAPARWRRGRPPRWCCPGACGTRPSSWRACENTRAHTHTRRGGREPPGTSVPRA